MRLESPQYELMEWSSRAALALGPPVGKRPRKTAAGCMHQICPKSLLNALTGTHTGGWRIIPREKLDGAAPHARSTPRESPLAVSADASTRLPAEPSSCPLAIKPFPNNVGSSVTKTAPANIIRPANMAVATLIGELWPSCHQVFINSSACCHQVPF